MNTDMTPQYQAELKQLNQQLGRDAKHTRREIERLERTRRANDNWRNKELRQIRRAAAQAEKCVLKAHRKTDRPLLRQIHAAQRGQEKREAAIQKRIDILTGRLGS